MKRFALLVAALAAVACDRPSATTPPPHPIVGTWMVTDSNAPFPYHLYVFNADGTMQQANPDAGDPRTSDSDGKGAWVASGDHVNVRWVEFMADRQTHAYAGRLDIRMRIVVSGDSLSATESVRLFDVSGAEQPVPPAPKPLSGVRVTVTPERQ